MQVIDVKNIARECPSNENDDMNKDIKVEMIDLLVKKMVSM